MAKVDNDRLLRRLESQAVKLGDYSAFEDCKYVGVDELGRPVKQPRWKLSTRWIEFECGCTAERISDLGNRAMPWDPVIFVGLPEQAVYERVCWYHEPHMNKRLGMSGKYRTFRSWKEGRRKILIGK